MCTHLERCCAERPRWVLHSVRYTSVEVAKGASWGGGELQGGSSAPMNGGAITLMPRVQTL